MSKSISTLTTKRFVIRKSLIGTNTIITFMNKIKISRGAIQAEITGLEDPSKL